MAKEATFQVRMDAELKEEVETLYQKLGTSFAEAVRIFARQSVHEQGMPFIVTTEKARTYGHLEKYANANMLLREEGAYEKAVIEKHEKTD